MDKSILIIASLYLFRKCFQSRKYNICDVTKGSNPLLVTPHGLLVSFQKRWKVHQSISVSGEVKEVTNRGLSMMFPGDV